MSRVPTALLVLACASLATRARAQPFDDRLIAEPALARPQAGSVVGAYAGTAFGPGDLARGSLSLPGPIELPSARGAVGIAVTPRYSPEQGLSEWGMGWGAALVIQRFAEVGDLGFDERDALSTPWGPMRRGSDGRYYTRGLASKVRVSASADDLVAVDEAGTRYVFSARAGVLAPRGTYQWNLTRVETLLGDRTELFWEATEGGRPYLVRVEYGGRGAAPRQVRVALAYEPVATPTLDFRAERPLRLDRRVSRVDVSMRDGDGYSLRWRYHLGYEDSRSGPAFYLRTVQRELASGARDPAFSYTYAQGFADTASLALVATDALDPVLRRFGVDALQPGRVAYLDVDGDGTSELEHHLDQAQLRWDGDAVVIDELPRDGSEDPACRPARAVTNAPRSFARLRPDDAEPRVLSLQPGRYDTTVRVCDRQGHLVASTEVVGRWSLEDPYTVLADVNRDGRPDAVRLASGGYQILLNRSDATGYRFEALAPVRLATRVDATSLAAHDLNGDGNVDSRGSLRRRRRRAVRARQPRVRPRAGGLSVLRRGRSLRVRHRLRDDLLRRQRRRPTRRAAERRHSAAGVRQPRRRVRRAARARAAPAGPARLSRGRRSARFG